MYVDSVKNDPVGFITISLARSEEQHRKREDLMSFAAERVFLSTCQRNDSTWIIQVGDLHQCRSNSGLIRHCEDPSIQILVLPAARSRPKACLPFLNRCNTVDTNSRPDSQPRKSPSARDWGRELLQDLWNIHPPDL